MPEHVALRRRKSNLSDHKSSRKRTVINSPQPSTSSPVGPSSPTASVGKGHLSMDQLIGIDDRFREIVTKPALLDPNIDWSLISSYRQNSIRWLLLKAFIKRSCCTCCPEDEEEKHVRQPTGLAALRLFFASLFSSGFGLFSMTFRDPKVEKEYLRYIHHKKYFPTIFLMTLCCVAIIMQIVVAPFDLLDRIVIIVAFTGIVACIVIWSTLITFYPAAQTPDHIYFVAATYDYGCFIAVSLFTSFALFVSAGDRWRCLSAWSDRMLSVGSLATFTQTHYNYYYTGDTIWEEAMLNDTTVPSLSGVMTALGKQLFCESQISWPSVAVYVLIPMISGPRFHLVPVILLISAVAYVAGLWQLGRLGEGGVLGSRFGKRYLYYHNERTYTMGNHSTDTFQIKPLLSQPMTDLDLRADVYIALLAVIVTLYRYGCERSNRHQFRLYAFANDQLRRTWEQRNALRKDIDQLVPHATRTKLLGSASLLDHANLRFSLRDRPTDSHGSPSTEFSPSCTCAKIEVVNLEHLFNAASDISESLRALVLIRRYMVQLCDTADVERVAAHGDSFCVTSNMLRGNGAHHALTVARFAVTAVAQIRAMHKQLSLNSGQQNVQLRAGVHSGLLFGGVTGVTHVTYGLYGETFQGARALIGIAGPSEVVVSEDTAMLAAPHLRTFPLDKTVTIPKALQFDVSGDSITTNTSERVIVALLAMESVLDSPSLGMPRHGHSLSRLPTIFSPFSQPVKIRILKDSAEERDSEDERLEAAAATAVLNSNVGEAIGARIEMRLIPPHQPADTTAEVEVEEKIATAPSEATRESAPGLTMENSSPGGLTSSAGQRLLSIDDGEGDLAEGSDNSIRLKARVDPNSLLALARVLPLDSHSTLLTGTHPLARRGPPTSGFQTSGRNINTNNASVSSHMSPLNDVSNSISSTGANNPLAGRPTSKGHEGGEGVPAHIAAMAAKKKSRKAPEVKDTIVDIHRRCTRKRSLIFFEYLADSRYERQFQNSRERLSIERSFLPAAIPMALVILTWATTVFIEPYDMNALENATNPAAEAAIWWLTQPPSLLAGSSMELHSTRLYIACLASALLFGLVLLIMGLRSFSSWILTWIAATFCFVAHLCALIACALVRGRGPMAFCSCSAMVCAAVSLSQAPFSSRINSLMITLSLVSYFIADRLEGGPIQWQAIVCILGITQESIITGEWKQREQRSAFVDALVASVAYDLAERDARQHAAVLSAAVPAPLQRRFFKMKASLSSVVDVRLCSGAVVLAFRFDRVEEEIARRMKALGKGYANENVASFSSNLLQPQLATYHNLSYPISPMLIVQSILRKLERSVELVSNWYFALTGTSVRQILSKTTPLDHLGSAVLRQRNKKQPAPDVKVGTTLLSADDTAAEGEGDTVTPKIRSHRRQAIAAAAADAPLSLFRVFGDTAFVCGPLGKHSAGQEGDGGLQESAAMSAMYLLLRFLSAVRSSAPAVRVGCGVAGGYVMSAMSRGELPSCEVYGGPMVTAKAILAAKVGGAQLPFERSALGRGSSSSLPTHIVGMTADCVDSALQGKRRWMECTNRNSGPLAEDWPTVPETAEDAAHRRRLFEEATARKQDAYAELSKLRKRCRGETPKVMMLPEGEVVVVPVKFLLHDPHETHDASKQAAATAVGGTAETSSPESPQDDEGGQPILSPIGITPPAFPADPNGLTQSTVSPQPLPNSPHEQGQLQSPMSQTRRPPQQGGAKDDASTPANGRFIDFVNM